MAAPRTKGFRWSETRAALGSVRAEGYGVALDFQDLWKSAAWARFSGPRRVVGLARPWRREPASAFLVGERAELPAGREQVIDKNLSLLGPLGIEATGLREFPLPFSEETAARLRELEMGEYAILNPAAGWASKLWPAERFGELARRARLGVPLLVAGEAFRVWASGHIDEDEGPGYGRPLRPLPSPPLGGEPPHRPRGGGGLGQPLGGPRGGGLLPGLLLLGDARGDRLHRVLRGLIILNLH